MEGRRNGMCFELKCFLNHTRRCRNDGSIDLYFKCRDNCPDAKEEMSEIRQGVKRSIPVIKKYGGGLPKQTMIGYHLFAAFPNLYGWLLKFVADMSKVEKYS